MESAAVRGLSPLALARSIPARCQTCHTACDKFSEANRRTALWKEEAHAVIRQTTHLERHRTGAHDAGMENLFLEDPRSRQF